MKAHSPSQVISSNLALPEIPNEHLLGQIQPSMHYIYLMHGAIDQRSMMTGMINCSCLVSLLSQKQEHVNPFIIIHATFYDQDVCTAKAFLGPYDYRWIEDQCRLSTSVKMSIFCLADQHKQHAAHTQMDRCSCLLLPAHLICIKNTCQQCEQVRILSPTHSLILSFHSFQVSRYSSVRYICGEMVHYHCMLLQIDCWN